MVVLGEALEAELVREPQHMALGGPHPLAAEVHDFAPEGLAERASPDALPCFEHGHGEPRSCEGPRGGEPRDSGADDDDICPARIHVPSGAGLYACARAYRGYDGVFFFGGW